MFACTRGAEQPWFVEHMNLIAAGRLKGQIQRVGDVLGPHVCAEFPSLPGHCAVMSREGDDLQIGEVRLPQLVDGCGFVFELARRLYNDEGWAGDQIVRLQDPIRRSL